MTTRTIPAFSFSFVEYVARKAKEVGWHAEMLSSDYIMLCEDERVPVLTIDAPYRNGLATHLLFGKQYRLRSEASVKRTIRRLVQREKQYQAYTASVIDILVQETLDTLVDYAAS